MLSFKTIKENAELNKTDFASQLFEDAFRLGVTRDELIYALREAAALLSYYGLSGEFVEALQDNTSVFEEE